jgi:hypothetical protein
MKFFTFRAVLSQSRFSRENFVKCRSDANRWAVAEQLRKNTLRPRESCENLEMWKRILDLDTNLFSRGASHRAESVWVLIAHRFLRRLHVRDSSKIIKSSDPRVPDKAEIAVEGADELHREIWIDNALTVRDGNEVALN